MLLHEYVSLLPEVLDLGHLANLHSIHLAPTLHLKYLSEIPLAHLLDHLEVRELQVLLPSPQTFLGFFFGQLARYHLA